MIVDVIAGENRRYSIHCALVPVRDGYEIHIVRANSAPLLFEAHLIEAVKGVVANTASNAMDIVVAAVVDIIDELAEKAAT